MLGKKSFEKSAKNVFFLFKRISLQKNAGKKTRETIFQKHTNSASKKCGKKSSGKRAKKRFLFSHEYRDTKRGRKTREISFPETHE